MYSLLSNSLKLVHTAGHVELMLTVWLGTFLSVTQRYVHTFFLFSLLQTHLCAVSGKRISSKGLHTPPSAVCVPSTLGCSIESNASRSEPTPAPTSFSFALLALSELHWLLICEICYVTEAVSLGRYMTISEINVCLFIITVWHSCSFHIIQFWNPMWSLGVTLIAVAF